MTSSVSVNQILYITVLVILFIILNIFVGIKHMIKNYNLIIFVLCLVIIIVLGTLSAIN
jgi:hypothetical protein